MIYPRVPLKDMDPAMLVFELNRETQRLMPQDSELITSAATLASYLHRSQTRMVRGDLPRVPYIEHPLRVALRLIRWGVTDAQLVAAALLHDVIEDCSEELIGTFGQAAAGGDIHTVAANTLALQYDPRISELVQAVTNPVSADAAATGGYPVHLAQLAAQGRSEALLIKASDLKDNAGSIQHQLGHGKDEKLLRLANKYYGPVKNLRVELEVRAQDALMSTAGNADSSLIQPLAQAAEALGDVLDSLREILI